MIEAAALLGIFGLMMATVAIGLGDQRGLLSAMLVIGAAVVAWAADLLWGERA